MRELFFKQEMVKAVISFVAGIIISFCSFLYIAHNIYVEGYNLTFPIIMFILGVIMVGWSVYVIKRLGVAADRADPDFYEK